MKVIRWILGKLILLFDAVFKPKQRTRSSQEQQNVDAQTQELKLFQYQACPFCVKVRREMHRQSLSIQLIDAKESNNKQTLLTEGGKVQVPCLQINNNGKTEWLYESKAIIHYLQDRFA